MLNIYAFSVIKSAEITLPFETAIAEQKKLLEKTESAYDQADIKINIGIVLVRSGKLEEAEPYFSEALTLLDKNSCSASKTYAEIYLHYLNSLKNDKLNENATSNFLFCARELKDVYLQSEIHKLNGDQLTFKGNYSSAFASYYKAKELKVKIDDGTGIIELNIAIAEALTRIGQPASARLNLQESLVLNKEIGHVHHFARIYNLLAINYLNQKNYNYAKIYINKALTAANSVNNPYEKARSYLAMASTNLALGDIINAGLNLNKVGETPDLASFKLLYNEYLGHQAVYKLAGNDAQGAIKLANGIINGGKEYVSQYDVSNAYEFLSKAHYSLKDYKKAFDLYEQYDKLKAKNGVSGAYTQFEQLKAKSEQVLNETKNIQNKAENELNFQEQKTSVVIKYALIMGLILMSIILLVLFRQVVAKQKNNAILQQRNALINKQNTELRLMNSVLEDARQQAEAGSIAKSNFLAVTSHEIRTPMNGVMGMASLLLETKLNLEQRKFVETIQTSSENLLTILNDILDFSKIEAGKMNLESSVIGLEKLLEEVMLIFAKQAKDKNIRLIKNISSETIQHFRGDALRMRQVLINLVSNAVKFTTNGTVEIRVGIDGPQISKSEQAQMVKLKFCVQDDGIGITDEKQKKIFESFEQEDSSTSRKYGGIGLGLSISKKLVELMGGEIGLASKKGKGTTFFFTLFAEIPSFERERETKINQLITPIDELTSYPINTAAFANEYPLRILLAEDNPFNKLFVDKLLEKFGYTDYAHAENGEEVLKILEEQEIDIILMDIQMPEMDGMEATRLIIEKYGEARPIIIALTADANDSSKDEYLNAGMDGFLSKPFKQEALQAILLEHGKTANVPV